MNLVDNIISIFSPEKALKRQLAREAINAVRYGRGSGYGYGSHGASYAKKSLTGWIARGMSADEDIADNIETMRARSRDLYMGSPLATGAIKTVRTNVVGSGLSLNAQIDAEFLGLTDEEARKWEADVEREWKLWSAGVDCDAERCQNFYQLQSLVMISALLSGDVFVTMPVIKRAGSVYDLRVGLIEADRVCDPDPMPAGKNIVGGIEVGTYGETRAVWVANKNPNTYPRWNDTRMTKWTRVQAFGTTTGRKNILHIMSDVERPAQRRGVPMLAPVIETLKQLTRYTEAELMASVISGMFTVFVKSDSPESPLGAGAFPPMPQAVQRDPNDYALGNGSIVQLNSDESIDIANPSRPNTSFDGFVLAVCRQIGTAMEIPYELLIKNFTASYSASRASLLEAWKMFRMRREWLTSQFCQPVYEEWLTEAVLKGRIKANGFFTDPAIRQAWSGAEWYGDSQGQLDPLKEANASKVLVEEGFSTREREAMKLTGMQWENITRQRKTEEEQRKESGLTATPQTPQPQETDDES